MMKLSVLVDNNTLINRNYFGEPGLSFYIEEGNHKILFDAGYSDIFLRNAYRMGIDLKAIDYIVLSHGHYDHTWGLSSLLGVANYFGPSKSEITLLAHPAAFAAKEYDGEQIGMAISPEVLKKAFHVKTSKVPYWISDRLVFLGEIERVHRFENKRPIGKTVSEANSGEMVDDYLMDDTALAYKTDKGIVIITGCSHAGICNIIDAAMKICGDDRIVDIIGGFHLLNPSEEKMQNTLEFINKIKPTQLHACHCTDLRSKIALSKVANLIEVGVGSEYQYD
jgi:7,8-dihydropterin-6-yl-methyl-4-(beta-D-ribofuranosyl)aminobenzene 5'-phosphate synthase